MAKKNSNWFQLCFGLVGGVAFLFGSIMFLPIFSDYATLGVWLFIVGSATLVIISLREIVQEIQLAYLQDEHE